MENKAKWIAIGLALLAKWVSADIIYSNDFNGTEFKADGVGEVVSGRVIESDGRLIATNVSANLVGFRVDLSALVLADDPDVTAVKLTISGKSPLAADGAGYLGLAFQNNANYNVNSWGTPVIAVTGTGNLRAAGGVGFANNAITGAALGENFTSGGEFTMSLVYNKNGTIDTWYNGVQYHLSAEISSSDTIGLAHAVISFRNLIIDNGANIDTFTVETIPEPATIGLFGISICAIIFCRRRMGR